MSSDMGRQEDSIVLQLDNGSITMDYGPGMISTGNGLLESDQWYQLYATRYVALYLMEDIKYSFPQG